MPYTDRLNTQNRFFKTCVAPYLERLPRSLNDEPFTFGVARKHASAILYRWRDYLYHMNETEFYCIKRMNFPAAPDTTYIEISFRDMPLKPVTTDVLKAVKQYREPDHVTAPDRLREIDDYLTKTGKPQNPQEAARQTYLDILETPYTACLSFTLNARSKAQAQDLIPQEYAAFHVKYGTLIDAGQEFTEQQFNDFVPQEKEPLEDFTQILDDA
jgi:hypothetical protein